VEYNIKIEIPKKIKKLTDIIKYVTKLKVDNNIQLAFRGEKEDYSSALTPSIYRNDAYIKNEELIYREMQRFNDNEFIDDRTTFDKLSRMQHYSAPTRLLDVSEDIMSAIYFAIDGNENNKENKDAIIYIFEIDKENIKYYDSDTVSVISNIVKIPLTQRNANEKSKRSLVCDVYKYENHKKKFNKQKSSKFLRHEIREEKPQFEAIINPQDLTSIQCVRPKLTSHRLKSQKGFFFLFGLNPEKFDKSIELINDNKLLNDSRINHPIKKIHKLRLDFNSIGKIQNDLKRLGITKPFIYPEIDKVSEHLKKIYEEENNG